MIPDQDKTLAAEEQVEKLVFCSGQVYYDIIKARKQAKKNKIAIVRVEQIAPFPLRQVQEQCNKYKNARVVWCQEEPFNMGAWGFVEGRANRVRILHSCFA